MENRNHARRRTGDENAKAAQWVQPMDLAKEFSRLKLKYPQLDITSLYVQFLKSRIKKIYSNKMAIKWFEEYLIKSF